MTDKNTVKTEGTDEKTAVAEISNGGFITIPKRMRGSEDGYTVEKRDDGRFVLTPIKLSHEPVPVEQSND